MRIKWRKDKSTGEKSLTSFESQQPERVANRLDKKIVSEDIPQRRRALPNILANRKIASSGTIKISRKKKIALIVAALTLIGGGLLAVINMNYRGSKQGADSIQAESRDGLDESKLETAIEAMKKNPNAVTKDESEITEKVMTPEESEDAYEKELESKVWESTQINTFRVPQ